jgi:hypothetical protein
VVVILALMIGGGIVIGAMANLKELSYAFGLMLFLITTIFSVAAVTRWLMP